MASIVERLQSAQAIQGELIYAMGEESHNIYFVVHGRVAEAQPAMSDAAKEELARLITQKTAKQAKLARTKSTETDVQAEQTTLRGSANKIASLMGMGGYEVCKTYTSGEYFGADELYHM